MKRLLLLLMCAFFLFSTLTACGEQKKDTPSTTSATADTSAKAFIGKYYSSQAKVMGTDATVEILEDGTFVMVSKYEKTKSTITGTYKVFTETDLLLLPENQVLIENGKKTKNDMSDESSTLATLKGDDLIFSAGATNEVVYTRITE